MGVHVPVLSVIVPVRNGFPWLSEQLEALGNQRCDDRWEVVIADNGSTDGSRELAESWAAHRGNARVVDASAVPGAPAARNVGVRASRGELLAFCDADDRVDPDWVRGCIDALNGAELVAGVFDFSSLNGLGETAAVPAATRQLGFLPAGLTANLAVRRDAFEAVSGFDEALLLGDDIDFCWRVQLRGYRFAIARNALVAKRERSTAREVFRQSTAYGRCGPVLYRRHRVNGAHRDLRGATKAWVWLVVASPRLFQPSQRARWVRTAGVRLGRLSGSVRQRTFYP